MQEDKDDLEGLTADDIELVMDDEMAGDMKELEALAEEDRALDEMTLVEEINQLNEKYMRLYAEFENFKKRMAKEKQTAYDYASETVIHELLPTIDNLEAALSHTSPEDSGGGFLQGVEATHRELMRTLQKFGLSAIEARGKQFDPAFHHAVSQAEREGVEEGLVLEEFRKGYLYKGKVLRATLVVVSKAPARTDND